MPGDRHVTRRRFFWGMVFLVVGASALAVNLGIIDFRDWYHSWPIFLIALGLLQLVFPGTARGRFGGLTLVGIGVYCYISVYELFGLHWGTAWPILLVSLGIRIVLTGLFPASSSTSGDQNGPTTGPGGVS